MAGVERRLNTYVGKEVTHCGHDELVKRADHARNRLMLWLEREIEELSRQAGNCPPDEYLTERGEE